MIQINLVPDVKQELLKAQRVRATVISFAVGIGLIAVGVVVVLALYVFVAQTARGFISDNSIKSESAKLAKIPDLTDMLTIQNQMTKISDVHNSTHVNSRLFDVLVAINPPAPNNVTISTLKLDSTTNTLTIDGQAVNGYAALEVFKKTILGTNMNYVDQNNQKQQVPLASSVSLGDTSYGQDASGNQVLRFSITITYPSDIFARTSASASISPLGSQENVTDSHVRVPDSIFSDKAQNLGGGQ